MGTSSSVSSSQEIDSTKRYGSRIRTGRRPMQPGLASTVPAGRQPDVNQELDAVRLGQHDRSNEVRRHCHVWSRAPTPSSPSCLSISLGLPLVSSSSASPASISAGDIPSVAAGDADEDPRCRRRKVRIKEKVTTYPGSVSHWAMMASWLWGFEVYWESHRADESDVVNGPRRSRLVCG